MIKRKINKENLRRILASDVKNKELDALDLALTLKNFADGLMREALEVEIIGNANGHVNVKLPVLSYLVRLLCEAAHDTPAQCTVTLADSLEIKTLYPDISNTVHTAYLIEVAKLAGFKVTREDDILYFTTDIVRSYVMKIYAVSSDEIMDWLVKVSQM